MGIFFMEISFMVGEVPVRWLRRRCLRLRLFLAVEK